MKLEENNNLHFFNRIKKNFISQICKNYFEDSLIYFELSILKILKNIDLGNIS
jgi:hypothetical protein